MTVLGAIALAIFLVGSFFTIYHIKQIVEMDARARGMKHAKGWGWFSAVGQGGEGLFYYLIVRNKYKDYEMSQADFEKFKTLKKRAGVSIAFLATGAILFIVFLMQQVK